MTIEVNRKELVRLLTTLNPDYSDMDKLKKLGFGRYIGGFCEKWEWEFDNMYDSILSDEEIYDLYKLIKR